MVPETTATFLSLSSATVGTLVASRLSRDAPVTKNNGKKDDQKYRPESEEKSGSPKPETELQLADATLDIGTKDKKDKNRKNVLTVCVCDEWCCTDGLISDVR